jgi:AraC family transcriptional regulator
LSISAFAHSFKKVIGISPYQFIIQQRLERAIELLLDRDANLPIAKIYPMCGFSSQSAFATRFRQKHGMSPAKYRLAHGDFLATSESE